MDWERLHAFAGELNFWTSLAVNCWLLISGFSFAFLVAWRHGKLPTALQTRGMAIYALLTTILLGLAVTAAVIAQAHFPNFLLNIPHLGTLQAFDLTLIASALPLLLLIAWIRQAVEAQTEEFSN
jgi:hypothetical protein